MSSAPSNCWTVQPKSGVMSSEMWATYSELMREQGLRQAPDKRVPRADATTELITDAGRLCVWDQRPVAEAFAVELTKRTRCEWIVVATHCDEE